MPIFLLFSPIFPILCLFVFLFLQPPSACYRSLSGPSGPKSPESVPRGVSGALWAPGSGVPKSVPRMSPECQKGVRHTLGTLLGHSGARGPKGPRDTLRDTPRTLRARRARETPVAGRGRLQSYFLDLGVFLFCSWPTQEQPYRGRELSEAETPQK